MVLGFFGAQPTDVMRPPTLVGPTSSHWDAPGCGANVAAAREDERNVVSILIQTTANFNGANPTFQPIWLFTNDSGATWTKVAIPSTANVSTVHYQALGAGTYTFYFLAKQGVAGEPTLTVDD